MALPRSFRRSTTDSSPFFSLPSSWARFESDQTFGSSRALVTVARRVCFASKSKIPPQLALARGEIREGVREGIQALGVHAFSLDRKREVYPSGPFGPATFAGAAPAQ
jgi:hypothetical protein